MKFQNKAVCPSISISALISTLELKVDIPVTLRVSEILVISSSVTPSTSKSPLASMEPVNVVTPEMFTLSNSGNELGKHAKLISNRILVFNFSAGFPAFANIHGTNHSH